MRVWDTDLPSNPIRVAIDGTDVITFHYNGTLAPIQQLVYSGGLEKGVHSLSLTVENAANLAQFMSLDYVTLTWTIP